ncbi:hypothetical protein GH714_012046 [Hevea brasiliensis]|uniref:Uncharacterized protein n=1 Tax=Hevea brasiliensis TaxID=3981 RepID=A0A6A6LL33_HEVBR|nr:hypothetical protein GH714_012046 [Hevea brasiliensis]
MTDSQNSSHSSDSVGTVTHACNPSEDISLPYYLHHSGNHSSVIVTLELTSANFASWRRSFLLAVSIKNKQGFLDGSIPKPTPEDPLYLSWVRCNNLLVAWLLKLIGFPPDFKFTKPKGNAGGSSSSKPTSAYQVSTTKAIAESVADGLSQITVSKEQVHKLMTLLNDQIHSTSNSNISFSPISPTPQVNVAVNTGPTNHIVCNSSLFSSYKSLSNAFVSLPNGVKVPVTAIGQVSFNSCLTLHKVLLVPSFNFNLISVSKLVTTQKSFYTSSSNTSVPISSSSLSIDPLLVDPSPAVPLRRSSRQKIARSSKGIVISQRKFVLEMLKEYGLLGSKRSSVPVEVNLKMVHGDENLLANPTCYRQLIGKLMYITLARPDISYGVQVLSQFMDKPTEVRMVAAKQHP